MRHVLPLQGRQGLVQQDDEHSSIQPGTGNLCLPSLTSPHVLAMSATPIPRTLALAQHGDMAMSIISCLPPGRTRVATKVFEDGPDGRSEAYRVSSYQALPLPGSGALSC
jgi:hypothetical protein